MLTSSDPVSEGLAFLGAMTGESDPSKSNWKKTPKKIKSYKLTDHLKEFSYQFHQLWKLRKVTKTHFFIWKNMNTFPLRGLWRRNEIIYTRHLVQCLGSQALQWWFPFLPDFWDDTDHHCFSKTRTFSHIPNMLSTTQC